jgi:hypothetical protein
MTTDNHVLPERQVEKRVSVSADEICMCIEEDGDLPGIEICAPLPPAVKECCERGIEWLRTNMECIEVGSMGGNQLIFHQKGVDYMVPKQKGGVTQHILSDLPIVPVAIIKPYDAPQDMRVRLQCLPPASMTPVEVTVSMGALTDPASHRDELSPLVSMGFPMTQLRSAKYTLVQAIRDAALKLLEQGLLARETGAVACGWHFPWSVPEGATEDILTAEPIHILPGCKEYIGNDPAIVSQRGSYRKWRSLVKLVVKTSPVTAIMMSAAAGSLLRGWDGVNVQSMGLHLWGLTSAGKTLSMKFANSMLGHPLTPGLLNSWDVSKPGLSALAVGTANHSYICLDEVSTLFDSVKSPKDVVMSIFNDAPPVRSEKNRKRRAESNWNMTVLSTGNQSLVEVAAGSTQDHALKARVMEIDLTQYPVWPWNDSDLAGKYEAVICKHYGHVYPLLVDGIKKDHTRYIGLYKNYQAKVSERVSKIDGANYIARRARGWALCYAGMHILQDALGIDFSNAIELLDKIVYGDIDMAEQKIQTRATDVAGQLSAYVNRHLKHCKINGFWATSEDDMAPEVQALRAKELSRKADDNGVYIIVDQKDAMTEPGRITGRVFISKEATTALKDDLQIHQLAIKAREAGMLYLPESEKARGALLIRVCRGAIQRAYVFDATQTEAPF